MPRRAVFAALALALSMLGAPVHAQSATECGLRMRASLPIRPDIVGRPLVPARIEGHDTLLLVDTGAIYSLLTDDTARAMKLPSQPVRAHEFVFINGDSAQQTARVRSLVLGQMPFRNLTFLVTPPSMKVPGASGALGPDIMHGFDVELDFAARRFNIFSQDHCDGGVVYWTKQPHAELAFGPDESGHLSATAMLDDKLIDVFIDTGTVATTMSLGDASDFGIGPGSARVQRIASGDVAGEIIYSYPFNRLDLQGVTVNHPEILIRSDRTGLPPSGLRPELVLGMNLLRKFHLFIAYGERKIYITGANVR